MPFKPALKELEPKSAILSRENWRQTNNSQNQNHGKKQAKMAKRLEPIKKLLASLPKPIARQMETLVISILSQAI